MRSVARIAGVSFNTVKKLLIDVGKVCMAFHDDKVQNVHAKRIQADEIWTRSLQKVCKSHQAAAFDFVTTLMPSANC